MPMEDYYQVFFLQAWTPHENGFWGVVSDLSDGLKVMGMLLKARQSEVRVAEAQGLAAQYNFATDIQLNLEINDIIRRESDDTFYRVSGLPEKSPEQAVSQFQLIPVELTSRESIARCVHE